MREGTRSAPLSRRRVTSTDNMRCGIPRAESRQTVRLARRPVNANRFGGDTLITIARLPTRLLAWRGSDLLEPPISNASFLTLMARDGTRDYIHLAVTLAHFVRGHRERREIDARHCRFDGERRKPIALKAHDRRSRSRLSKISE